MRILLVLITLFSFTGCAGMMAEDRRRQAVFNERLLRIWEQKPPTQNLSTLYEIIEKQEKRIGVMEQRMEVLLKQQ